jgi:hypothetical protein
LNWRHSTVGGQHVGAGGILQPESTPKEACGRTCWRPGLASSTPWSAVAATHDTYSIPRRFLIDGPDHDLAARNSTGSNFTKVEDQAYAEATPLSDLSNSAQPERLIQRTGTRLLQHQDPRGLETAWVRKKQKKKPSKLREKGSAGDLPCGVVELGRGKGGENRKA